MARPIRAVLFLCLAVCLLGGAVSRAALAQEAPPPPPSQPPPAAAPAPAPPPGAPVRLFRQFVTDGAIQPNVWLEGQWRMESNAPLFTGDNGTVNYLSGILALGFGKRVEAGLSWGGIDVDPDQGNSHSGVADLNLYAKYLLLDSDLKLAAGGLVKIPAADSDKGLGSGSSDWEAFLGLRRNFGAIQAVASAGLRQNGDPDVSDVHGEASFLAGGGVIFELGRRSFGTLEFNYESRRYEGLSSDVRMTPGFFLRLRERGFFRAAAGIGLSDGAPDWEGIAGFGWAY
jgi:hypothetical protein